MEKQAEMVRQSVAAGYVLTAEDVARLSKVDEHMTAIATTK